MSREQHLIPTATRHSESAPKRTSTSVGRRESEAAAVYTVTGTSVERLRSSPTTRQSSPDWHGSEAARIELSRLLISRLIGRPPSRDLQTRFALYVLRRLPQEGFVLDSGDRSRWLRLAGDAHERARAPARQSRFGQHTPCESMACSWIG
jgi:hypothetical protein